MAVESDADRLTFLEDWDTALYNGVSTISCIFDAEYIDVLGDVGVGSTHPAALCRTSDVPAAAHGIAMVINSVNYTIAGPPQPTGDGFTLLMLEAV